MNESGGGIGLPQMSEREMFEMLLSEDEYMTSDEPEIAANIGEQMIHMGLRPLSRTIRSRICLLYTSPSPRDRTRSRMPSSA